MRINGTSFYRNHKIQFKKSIDAQQPMASNVQPELSFKDKFKNNKTLKYGCLALPFVIAVAAITKGKSIYKSGLNMTQKIINRNKNYPVDVSYTNLSDFNADFKKEFLKDLEKLKNPYEYIHRPNGETEKKSRLIHNGYMLTGPNSKEKEEMFNWMIDELKKRGVKVIDASDGKQSKFDDINKAWWEMWRLQGDTNKGCDEFKIIDEEFKKGEYKAFVVRGLDEIGQPTHSKNFTKHPESKLLKDSPDTNNCLSRHGVMLLYTCKDTSKVDPAVIRSGRIDVRHVPVPKENEPLAIWKEYLEEVKWAYNPLDVVKRLDSTKKVLEKRGEKVMKELAPNFEYSIPYKMPMASDSKKKWKDFIQKTAQNVDGKKAINEMIAAWIGFKHKTIPNKKGLKKIDNLQKMMRNALKPEDRELWDKHIFSEKSGIRIEYLSDEYYLKHKGDIL